MRGLGRTLLVLAVLIMGGALLGASRHDMLVAQGSDSATTFFRPALWSQVLALLLLGFSVFGAAGGFAQIIPLPRGRAAATWGLAVLLSLAALAMSLHQFTLDDRRLSDVWIVWPDQSIPLGEEGLPRASISRAGPFFLEVQDEREGRVRLFLGIFPWRIDPEPLLSHPLIVAASPTG